MSDERTKIIKRLAAWAENPYPGVEMDQLARDVRALIDYQPERERDLLWCEALSVLDPRDVLKVLEYFNAHRPD